MATPTTWAQEIITCDLCDNSAQQFCNNCQVSLCVTCVSKHVDKFKYQQHDIVHFKDRKMAFPECRIHPKQRCEAHCKRCEVPVCMKCVLGPHKGHDAVELSDIIESKKQEIKKETQEIESIIIPGYKKKSEETDNQLDIANAKFDELEEETGKDRKFWHQEVDNIFNKFDSTIKSIKESQLAVLKSHHSKLSNRIQEMTETVQRNKKILQSKTMLDVTSYKSKLGEYRKMPTDIDVEIPALKTDAVEGRELRVELGEYQAMMIHGTLDKFSNISLDKLLDEAKLIASVPIPDKPIHAVACVGVDEAWVSGDDKTIRRFDIHGFERGSFTSHSAPNDIVVTRQGELVYLDVKATMRATVNIVREGKTETLITAPMGWYLHGLCCTRTGDILVSMVTNDYCYRKIVRCQGQRVTQEIYKDENEQLIFEKGENFLWVVENNNGDICASDNNAGMVVVVNESGRVRFRYDGKPARRKKSFIPEQLVTDSMNQIIVADYNNACLHILDQNGQFMRCVDNCGLDKPIGLGIDSEGRLWVGLDKGEVKVIQYMK